jgi:hypothetical protein
MVHAYRDKRIVGVFFVRFSCAASFEDSKGHLGGGYKGLSKLKEVDSSMSAFLNGNFKHAFI